MDNIEIKKQIDLRILNLSTNHDKDIIQSIDEAASIIDEKSPYWFE